MLTQMLATHRGRRDAMRFESSVVVGRTYYSIDDCKQPWGDEQMVRTWKFRKTRLGALKHVDSNMSPASVWLQFGPLFERDPGSHLRRLFEEARDLFTPADLVAARKKVRAAEKPNLTPRKKARLERDLKKLIDRLAA